MCWTGPDASICANSQPARLQMRQKQCRFSLHQAPVGLPMIESLLRRQQSLLLPHQHHDLSSLSVSFFGFCNSKFSVHDFCSHFDTLSSSSSLLQFTPLPLVLNISFSQLFCFFFTPNPFLSLLAPTFIPVHALGPRLRDTPFFDFLIAASIAFFDDFPIFFLFGSLLT